MSTAPETTEKKIRVLVVDDHSVVRQGLRMFLLVQPDMELVGEAQNGREAVALAAQFSPDVVLMDLMMPEMDGFEFLERVRQHPEWRLIPIVVLTAKDLTAEDRRRLAGSVDTILQKKSDSRDALLAEVRELVANCAA